MSKNVKVIAMDRNGKILVVLPVTSNGQYGTYSLPRCTTDIDSPSEEALKLCGVECLYDITSMKVSVDDVAEVITTEAGNFVVIVKVKEFPRNFRCNKEVFHADTNIRMPAVVQFEKVTVGRAIALVRNADRGLLRFVFGD